MNADMSRCSSPFNWGKQSRQAVALGRRGIRAQRFQPQVQAGTGQVASQRTDVQFSGLQQWLGQHGGAVHSAVQLADCQLGGASMRGLVVTRDVPAGTTLLSVPLGSSLRDADAPRPYPGAPWNVRLAAQLLLQHRHGAASPWAPYMDLLPRGIKDSPLCLNPAELAELVQYNPAVQALASFQAQVQEAFDAWSRKGSRHGDSYQRLPYQQEAQHGQRWTSSSATTSAAAATSSSSSSSPSSEATLAAPAGMTWEEWAWATHMVQSRSIRLALAGSRVMIPGIDLLNHGGPAANGQLRLGASEWQAADGDARSVCFVTTRDLAAGEQALWTYGDRSNDDFFAHHGFCIPDNPWDDVVLFDSVEAAAVWAAQRMGLDACFNGGSSSSAIIQVAEAAARDAAQAATIACSSPQVPGTSSSLLVPLQAQLQQQQQREPHGQQQQQRAPHGQQRQQQEVIDGAWQLQAWLLSLRRASGVERRLASLRLHRPDWGTPDCPPTAPELVARADGMLDVRLLGVLLALALQKPQQQSREVAASVLCLLQQRCEELLGAFPTSPEQDQRLLQQLDSDSSSTNDGTAALQRTAVLYRLGKKQVLRRWLESQLA